MTDELTPDPAPADALVRQGTELLGDQPALVVPPQGLLLPTNGHGPNRAQRRHQGRQ